MNASEWAADGPLATIFFLFIPGAPLGEDHRPLAGGRPTTHPSSASKKKNIQNPKFLTLSIPLIPSDLLRISTFSLAVQLR